MNTALARVKEYGVAGFVHAGIDRLARFAAGLQTPHDVLASTAAFMRWTDSTKPLCACALRCLTQLRSGFGAAGLRTTFTD